MNVTDAHAYFLCLDDGALRFEVECPYDPADESRPCWPYDEGGHYREPAPQTECVFREWADNTGPEDSLYGDVRIRVECVVRNEDAQPLWEVLGVAHEDGAA